MEVLTCVGARSSPELRDKNQMCAGPIEATRKLCDDLDNLIVLAMQDRAPIRALALVERARQDLQAYLDKIEAVPVRGFPGKD